MCFLVLWTLLYYYYYRCVMYLHLLPCHGEIKTIKRQHSARSNTALHPLSLTARMRNVADDCIHNGYRWHVCKQLVTVYWWCTTGLSLTYVDRYIFSLTANIGLFTLTYRLLQINDAQYTNISKIPRSTHDGIVSWLFDFKAYYTAIANGQNVVTLTLPIKEHLVCVMYQSWRKLTLSNDQRWNPHHCMDLSYVTRQTTHQSKISTLLILYESLT